MTGRDRPEGAGRPSLEDAELRLLRLARSIPAPARSERREQLFARLLGIRSAGLYANFLHSLGSPAAFAPAIALRPLVEAMLVLRWIELDVGLHGELWLADSEARDLASLGALLGHLGIGGGGDEVALGQLEAKRAVREAALSRARAAGKSYGRRAMPELARIVDEIAAADVAAGRPNGERIVREAYDAVYRAISPWTHSHAGSFKALAPDGSDPLPYSVLHLRAIAANSIALVLEQVGLAERDQGFVDATSAARSDAGAAADG